MSNRLALVSILFFASITAFGGTSVIEQEIIISSNKRIQDIATARVPIEARYLAILQSSYKKAESAKDLDLQVKIKKEIDIVERNLEYFKEKASEKPSDTTEKKVFGIKWVAANGFWVKIDDRKKMIWNNWGPSGSKANIDGYVFGGGVPGAQPYTYDPETDTIKFYDGTVFYREGKIPKSTGSKESVKAPEGEEVNTVFGRRVK